ncbi:uncharacterized protein LOC135961141 [Calliphora vicina]|uniref:uncharacterized protein LOC135961141 n=1 Tax=Calliphora vicina TaxID=7373 RepID=UPI00325B18A6
MNFVVKTLSVLLSVIALNVVLPIEAQLFGGTSVVLGKKHYYIETSNQGSFYEAAYSCAQLGMTLASIESKTEFNSLKSFLTNSEIIANVYWLSGISYGPLNTAKPYSWLGTGKPITYWSSDPELTNADQCLKTVTNTFEYAEGTCTESNYYICEKPLEPYCGKYGQCRYTYSSNSN